MPLDKRTYHREWMRRYRAAHPEAGRRAAIRSRYQLSDADIEEMYRLTCGLCAICGGVGKGGTLEVDHDHTTGRVRALLCPRCNKTLGHVREDPALLSDLASYAQTQPKE